MAKIGVLGAGGWGIALAVHSNSMGHTVKVWTPFELEFNQLNEKRENPKLLKGVKIPQSIIITKSIEELSNCDILIIATPSFAVRETAKRLKSCECNIIVNVSKGFEKESLLCLTDVIGQELPDKHIVVLSGPSHAEEVARGVPTSVVVASKDLNSAKFVQDALINKLFRIYTSNDVLGVEIGGALKNVIAVASGVEGGLKVGDNARAALMTRGLAEIARLGVAMGASRETFMGLSGLGDLIVTCMSEHSRNNRFGTLVGSGVSVKQALETVGTVEGYYATENAYFLSKKYEIEMPITEQCYNALYNDLPIEKIVENLMSRPGKTEDGSIWQTK